MKSPWVALPLRIGFRWFEWRPELRKAMRAFPKRPHNVAKILLARPVKGRYWPTVTRGAVNIRIAIAFDNLGPYHVARLVGAARHAEVLALETAATTAQYGWDTPE